jgi:hypothetical protein
MIFLSTHVITNNAHSTLHHSFQLLTCTFIPSMRRTVRAHAQKVDHRVAHRFTNAILSYTSDSFRRSRKRRRNTLHERTLNCVCVCAVHDVMVTFV